MLDPEQLQSFLHVVETGSLSRAAHRAHLSQPALSRQIKILEEELGVELFDRTGRGMRPTAAGRRLEPQARRVIASLHSLETEFQDVPIEGRLSLAISPTVGMAWSARVMRAFLQQYPAVELRVSVLLSGAMGGVLSRGGADLGVLYSPMPKSGLRTVELWQEPTFFVCRKEHPWVSEGRATLRNVLKEPLIVPSSLYGIRSLLEQQARNLGVPLNVELEVDSLQLALELVRQGAGNMLLTERALPDIAARCLTAVPIHRPSIVRRALLAGSEHALVRPVTRALWDFIVAEAEAGAK